MSSSQKLLALLVVACLVSLIAADYKCPPDKKWSTCARCNDHYCGGNDVPCAAVCKEGCVCKDSKHRLHDNACIPADKCPPWGDKCPPDMVWSDCARCNDHYCGGKDIACPAGCEKRCVCKNKDYRLHENKCVPADKCPGKCPPGAEWSKCSGCSDSCQKEGMVCMYGCKEGCKCKASGYKLHNNECIPADKCPGYCPQGAEWSKCSGCTASCQKQGTVCPAVCKEGCKCKDSEHRLQNNKCIHHTQCPDYCPPDMMWSDCASCKDHYCGGNHVSCLAVCEKRCVCKNKDYKLQGNKCIPAKECPGKCPTDMVWSDCCGCNDSCPKKDTFCKAGCEKAGCKCKDPEHRLQDNKCVHHKRCRSWGGNH